MIALPQRLVAEFLGTAALLATVVGSGIMAVQLSSGNLGVALLANAAATAAVLYVLITIFAPVSGAHFNPAVSIAFCLRGELAKRDTVAYVTVQVVAAIAGVMLAHAMFGHVLFEAGTQVRTGWSQWLSEFVATFGLLLVILLAVRQRVPHVAALVAAWIFAAYWFTASTSFANPAVTLARSLTTTFSGISPADVAAFVMAQLAGAVVAVAVARLLAPRRQDGSRAGDECATMGP